MGQQATLQGSSGGGVDTTAIHKTGDETVTSGVKTFAVSPVVPTPTTVNQASNKTYTDGAAFINAIIFG